MLLRRDLCITSADVLVLDNTINSKSMSKWSLIKEYMLLNTNFVRGAFR